LMHATALMALGLVKTSPEMHSIKQLLNDEVQSYYWSFCSSAKYLKYVPSMACQLVNCVVKNGLPDQYFKQIKTRSFKKSSKKFTFLLHRFIVLQILCLHINECAWWLFF
jgi:hypothetical protein